ncbi:MAG: sulfate reduction electron transfer complex DsrMKJOP subunit DsrM [Terriglobia bacterium]|nr:sulfate reduction electron transfer complex DsrMKJOP subunit DsrM [Terriglobia bacterium]
MAALYSFLAVAVVIAVAALAGRSSEGRFLLYTVIPYTAAAIFLGGFCYRVIAWAMSSVPFRIPTTAGQQKSLAWIRNAKLDNPFTGFAAVGRMAVEVLLFRSLFRNNRSRLEDGRLIFGENKYLWLAALSFHWSLLVILLRHLRLLIEPVPAFVLWLEKLDGFFQVGTPAIYMSDIVVIVALAYLLLRRFRDPLVRYVSLFTDYFALFLLLGIAITGFTMRNITRVDVVSVKQFALGIVSFHPAVPQNLGAMFLVHLALVATLAAYFPFSKLMHMGGIFLSPTRNLANNNRAQRHINPWNYPVKTHTYAEWEEEFHDKLEAAGIPLEKEHVGTSHAD